MRIEVLVIEKFKYYDSKFEKKIWSVIDDHAGVTRSVLKKGAKKSIKLLLNV